MDTTYLWSACIQHFSYIEFFACNEGEVTGNRLIFLLKTPKKLDVIRETSVFRYWTSGSAIQWSLKLKKKKNQISPQNCPNFLLERDFRPQCWEIQVKPSDVSWNWAVNSETKVIKELTGQSSGELPERERWGGLKITLKSYDHYWSTH